MARAIGSKKKPGISRRIMLLMVTLVRGCIYVVVRCWVMMSTRPLHSGVGRTFDELHAKGYSVVKTGHGNGSPSAGGTRISRSASGIVQLILSLEQLGYQITHNGRQPVVLGTETDTQAGGVAIEGRYLRIEPTGEHGIPEILLRGESGELLMAAGADLVAKVRKASLAPGDRVKVMHSGWSKNGARIFEISKVRAAQRRRVVSERMTAVDSQAQDGKVISEDDPEVRVDMS